MNLYQMTSDYQIVLDKFVSACDFFSNEEFDEWLSSKRDALDAKRLAVAAYIKNLEAEREAMTQAAENICERALKKEKHIKKLTEYLKYSMDKTGTSLVNGVEFDIKVKKNPPKLIIDETKLADEWFTQTTTRTPCGTLVKQALKSGAEIEGAHLEQTERLEIK